MTRIYTFGLAAASEKEEQYLMVFVAHRNSKGALRVALKEAGEKAKLRWRMIHKAEKRTGFRIPEGEVLGVTGPFSYAIEEA